MSVVDRISGYALGDFTKAMEMAKMNAHALAWRPSIIIRTAVAYFEDILNKESMKLSQSNSQNFTKRNEERIFLIQYYRS